MVNSGPTNSNVQRNGGHDERLPFEIKSKTVESLLQPLLAQLNSLGISSSSSSPPQQAICKSSSSSAAAAKKGRSKRANLLVESLVESIENFLRHGTDIAHENETMRADLLQSIHEIRMSGNLMIEASRDFASEPTSTQKRMLMAEASRDLLNSIAQLLAVADAVDVNALLGSIQAVQQDLINLKNSSNQDELTHHFKNYGRNLIELTNQTGKAVVSPCELSFLERNQKKIIDGKTNFIDFRC